jgi:hypothetical protein
MVTNANGQHAAMTQARVFWRDPDKFALLSLYEQRISRKLQRNEARLHALQAERKAALEAALEQAALLAQLAESTKETYDPAPDFAHLAKQQNGFGFSIEEFTRLLRLKQRLALAKTHAQTAARPPLRRAA